MTQVGSLPVAGYSPTIVARRTARPMAARAACFSVFGDPVTSAPSSITKSGWLSCRAPLNSETLPMKIPREPGFSRLSQWFAYPIARFCIFGLRGANSVMAR